jgi:hypothetical protein
MKERLKENSNDFKLKLEVLHQFSHDFELVGETHNPPFGLSLIWETLLVTDLNSSCLN